MHFWDPSQCTMCTLFNVQYDPVRSVRSRVNIVWVASSAILSNFPTIQILRDQMNQKNLFSSKSFFVKKKLYIQKEGPSPKMLVFVSKNAISSNAGTL